MSEQQPAADESDDSLGLSRRAVIALGGTGAIAGLTGAQEQMAEQIDIGGTDSAVPIKNRRLGPASELPDDSAGTEGDVYFTTTTGVGDYYHDGDQWNELDGGASEGTYESLHTESTDTGSLTLAGDEVTGTVEVDPDAQWREIKVEPPEGDPLDVTFDLASTDFQHGDELQLHFNASTKGGVATGEAVELTVNAITNASYEWIYEAGTTTSSGSGSAFLLQRTGSASPITGKWDIMHPPQDDMSRNRLSIIGNGISRPPDRDTLVRGSLDENLDNGVQSIELSFPEPMQSGWIKLKYRPA